MDKKKHQKEFDALAELFSNVNSTIFKNTSTDNLLKSFIDEELKINDFSSKSRKQGFTKVEKSTDSDEALKFELENAVKNYKKNVKLTQIPAIVSNSGMEKARKEEVQPAKSQSFRTSSNLKKNSETEELQMKRNHEKLNEDPKSDIQELISYFFLPKKNQVENPKTKSLSEYEKEGAIPKRKIAKDVNESKNSNEKTTKSKMKQKDQIKVEEDVKKPKGYQKEFSDGTLMYEPNTNEPIVKLSKKYCSAPFFYIVPENPSPNFFFSRGSYYVVPKTSVPLTEKNVVLHPDKDSPIDWKSEAQFQFDSKPKLGHDSQIPNLNNLGKDSHLNIGPSDEKLNEISTNLDNNCLPLKSHEKTLFSLNTSKTSNIVNESTPVIDKIKTIETETDREAEESLEESDEEESNNYFGSDENIIRDVARQKDYVMLTLITELPDLSPDTAQTLAEKYLFDEVGLKNYIASLKLKMENQLERMILALPESNYNELLSECLKFQGDEDRVLDYINKTQKANKINQRLENMLVIFPDADPNYMLDLIEPLTDSDGDVINTLINELLENKNYPKVFVDDFAGERKKLWNTYVTNFNVKKFVLSEPEPERFADHNGDYHMANEDLVLTFLTSRYPTLSPDLLKRQFQFNNMNLVKTCLELELSHSIVRLSKSSFHSAPFSEAFLKEVCYIDHKDEIDNYLKESKELKLIEVEEAKLNNSFLCCPLCADNEVITSEALTCPEGHVFCMDCIKRYILVKISDGLYKFRCPLESCDTFFSHYTLEKVLPDTVLTKIIQKEQAEEISIANVDGLESCPFCDFAYIPNPEDKIFKCQNPACLSEICRNCHEKNHIPLRCEEIEKPVDLEARKKIEEAMTKELIRACPKCRKNIVKIDGCNKMACPCGTIFCYICRTKIDDYRHFGNGRCPLHSNNNELHISKVLEVGVQVRNEITRNNPQVHILFDPTKVVEPDES